ncbi:hypothetical protein Sjap_014698 [Stephania japonica]|uniref:Uncharacterized protein n=1 Tax=Stephania japonica TaxID=461633 RepID=A0AAP0NTA2_9MAGN
MESKLAQRGSNKSKAKSLQNQAHTKVLLGQNECPPFHRLHRNCPCLNVRPKSYEHHKKQSYNSCK